MKTKQSKQIKEINEKLKELSIKNDLTYQSMIQKLEDYEKVYNKEKENDINILLDELLTLRE
jgi:membrane protein insertase Oxa1/YidC/SpoIIIJ